MNHHEDNDDALIGTIFTRREALATVAKAGFGLAFAGPGLVAAQQNPKVHLIASPALEEGPFFVDEKLNRSNLLSGTTRESVLNGVPLALAITIHKLHDGNIKPLAGAHVDVWHTDAVGVYSDEANPINHEDTSSQRWLRGYQVTDGYGLAKFQTIVPGWYPSRTTHIHLKIRHFSEAGQLTGHFNTQLFFDDRFVEHLFAKPPYSGRGTREVFNHNDGIFSQRQVDGTVAGSHLTLSLQKNPHSPGYNAEFSVALAWA